MDNYVVINSFGNNCREVKVTPALLVHLDLLDKMAFQDLREKMEKLESLV